MPGRSTVWRVVPDHDLTVALSIGSDARTALTDDVVVPLVEELTGVTVPPVHPGDGGRLTGRYATPLWDYEATADGGGRYLHAGRAAARV